MKAGVALLSVDRRLIVGHKGRRRRRPIHQGRSFLPSFFTEFFFFYRVVFRSDLTTNRFFDQV